MWGQGLLVVKPRVCRSDEVLVLKVDEGHCVPDQVDILAHDGVVNQSSILLEHVNLIHALL